ncbi:hypothetical protein EV368DRAFT_5217, partial [Lentinula lateritia]
RSPYIGFDSIYKNQTLTTKYPPIRNQPRVLAPVYADERNKVAPVWANRHLTEDGYVPIAERRLYVTSRVSTIVQFHIRDYGMEKCSVALEVPTHNFNGREEASIWGNDTTVDVWLLEGESKIDFQKLSWNTKPGRKSYIGSIQPTYNSKHELSAFPCISGSYLTLEVSCSSPDCHVDV